MAQTSPAPNFKAVVIGGSAGALEALKIVLASLPKDQSQRTYPVICVLHLLARGQSLLPEVFKYLCPWPVKEAESTELVQAGTVYFAAADYHLSVETDFTFSLSTEEPLMYSRPSIDLFFLSAAKVYKHELVALVLSGANADGARGLREILRVGGRYLAQAPETAEFREMPTAALQVSPNVSSLSLPEIVEFLNRRH